MEYVYSAIQIICAHLIIYELGQLSTRRAGLATEDRVIASPKGFNIFQWGRIEFFSLCVLVKKPLQWELICPNICREVIEN